MKNLIVIYIIFSALVFYSLSSVSPKLKSYFDLPQETLSPITEISKESISNKNVIFAVKKQSQPSSILCIKIDDCYFCKAGNSEI